MIQLSDTVQLWIFRTATFIAALIAVELVRRFVKARPCWFFNHRMKHLSIEKRVWSNNGICHRCNESLENGEYTESYKHFPHRRKVGDRTDYIPCYVTRWICAKDGCGEMGLYCVGSEDDGAWTIQHGEIVPDEKEWSKWKK